MKAVDTVEEQILEALLQFVLKLNEHSFKPFYMNVLEWGLKSAQEGGAQETLHARPRVFFRLVAVLCTHLKVACAGMCTSRVALILRATCLRVEHLCALLWLCL